MLIIRDAQMQVFAQVGLQQFTKRMVDRAQKLWPEVCQRIGEPATSEMVDSAVKRAFHYKLTTEYDVARYLDLVFAFENPEFDRTDWASKILKQLSVNPRRRMNILWKKAKEQLAEL